MKTKMNKLVRHILLSAVAGCLLSGNVKAQTSSDDPRESAMRFSNSLLGGLAEVSDDTIKSYKYCQENPDAERCEQRRLAGVRNVEASVKMLEALNKSGAINQLNNSRDNFQNEMEEVRQINKMCSEEPNSFVCTLVRDMIYSKLHNKNKKIIINGAVNNN